MPLNRLVIFLICVPVFVFSQLPETDLWLFKIKTENKQLQLGEGKNITARKGYDNQPFFTPDDKHILYVSIRDDKQADVYSYEIAKEQILQLTKTKVSEYSPIYTPDNKAISCVVVEADSTQRLWLYDLSGAAIKCFNEGIDSIGYYNWLSKDTLLYYKLTEPHSLRAYYKFNGQDVWIANSPSRAFKKTKGNVFIYAIKDTVSIQYRMYNTIIKRSDIYANHISKNEDFVWNINLGLLKSEGTQILRYDEKASSWLTLFDLKSVGIKKITRFAFDSKNKQLVIVDNN